MLESVAAVKARIAEIKSRFWSEGSQGVVSIAPHATAVPSQAANKVEAFFPDYLIEPARNLAGAEVHSPTAYDSLIESAAAKYGVDAALVKSVIRAESGFNPNAVSPAGARGLMQLMPATSAALGIGDPFDPAQNIDGGVRYLRQQIDRFGDVRLALAAYNAGPNAVAKYNGVPPYRQTRNYVARVLSYISSYEEGG